MLTTNSKINHHIAQIKRDLIKFLRDIIAIPSLSGKEEAVITRIKKEMEQLKYDRVWIDPMGNLFGQIGFGKKIIAIDGHIDTVDVGNPDNWAVDPFLGDYKNGIIHGRGASDQKSGLACIVYAGKIIKEIGIPKDYTILVVASVLEETSEGLCWDYIIKQSGITPHQIILTEPTDLDICIGQKGRLEMEISTKGKSSHGSAPQLGDNAIYKIAHIIREIESLNQGLKSNSILGKGTITISQISSTAPSLNAVADSATIYLDRRLTKGESLSKCKDELKNLHSIKSAKAKLKIPKYKVQSYTGLEFDQQSYYPMWLMDQSHPLVKKAQSTYKNLFGNMGKIRGWNFSTNGVITKGKYNIPTIGFGPGKEKFAHTPDEQVKIEDLYSAVAFYASFILSDYQ